MLLFLVSYVVLSFSFLVVVCLTTYDLLILVYCPFFSAVSEETCNEVESLVFDLFANLGATGAFF